MKNQRLTRVQKRKYTLTIAVTIFLCLIGLGIFVSVYFNTTKITVSGNEYYTENEIRKAVSSKGYIRNTLLMSMKSRIKEENYFPFIEDVKMSFHDPHILEVKVTEKVRAGAVKQGDDYYYFTLAGKVLEKKSGLFEGVAVLQDSEMEKIEVGKILPTAENRLKEIIQVVRGIANNNIEISKIRIKKSGEIVLSQGKFDILIGTSGYIDAKTAKIPELLQVVKEEYKKGKINMKLYTDSCEIITFQE